MIPWLLMTAPKPLDHPAFTNPFTTAPQSNLEMSSSFKMLSKVTMTATGASNCLKPLSTQSCLPSLSSLSMPISLKS